ncbi:STAS domain-containing protein [Streptomyces sp. NPDC059373]
MSDVQPGFVVAERLVGAITVVELRGELDIVAKTRITDHLESLARAPRPDLVLDLRQVTFVDCCGLSVLCRVQSRTARSGGRLRLVSHDPAFRRLLRLTALAGTFELFDDLASAIAQQPKDAIA